METGTSLRVNSCDGATLRGMFGLGTACLERSASAINALNVFPVPDGDTGTNMLLTMQATMEEARQQPGNSAGAVVRAMARGALMGARGNSGVILSQFLRGLADRLDNLDEITGTDLAAGLVAGATLAYKGVSRPVEGTILTVLREAAIAAQAEAARDGCDLTDVLIATARTARDTVARTPSLLPVLREAGVVDAGGQGISIILDGALHYLQGEREARGYADLGCVDARWLESSGQPTTETGYGYCTEFVLRPHQAGLEADAIQDRLVSLGASVLVVGDTELVRVHVHSQDPGAVLSYATSLGSLHQVKVQNMDEQHQDFLTKRPVATGPRMVAVASGDGLAEIFRSLGASVVAGGPTMNPSIRELLQAVDSMPATEVLLLPNDPNILPAANQVPALTSKRVAVVPARSIPEGVATAVAFDAEATLEANLQAMEAARRGVRSGEVTRSTRSVSLGGLKVRRGQPIALLDGELVAAGGSVTEVTCQLLSRIPLAPGNLITLYYGGGVQRAEAVAVAEAVGQCYPEQEVETVYGGQPHYEVLVSVE